ncbi:MAG: precorrin-6A reductase, partial [Acaryochloridaceae cyanobacterium RL_2_7]|nr:precorrin-6A reductase [Acaryochloridaceae cyanobacterium RL_2_7]
ETSTVEVTRFEHDEHLMHWLKERHITGILDASHPFAIEISTRAMRVAQQIGRPYLRFERSSVMADESDLVTELDQGLGTLSRERLAGQRVLLLIGSQGLSEFSQWQDCAELFARILPTESALQAASQAGFRRDHLIAFQPPLSFEMERSLWLHWQITLAITKASGQAGGEEIKRQVADDLKIPLLILKRPPLTYQWKTESPGTAIAFGQRATTFSKGEVF